jgi:hypothetical protein
MFTLSKILVKHLISWYLQETTGLAQYSEREIVAEKRVGVHEREVRLPQAVYFF